MSKLKIDLIAVLPPFGERTTEERRPATLSITAGKVHWRQPNGLYGKEPHIDLYCWMCEERRPLIDFLGYVGSHVHKKKTYGLLGRTATCRHCSAATLDEPGRMFHIHLGSKGEMLLHMTDVLDDSGAQVTAYTPDTYGKMAWRPLSEALEFRLMKKPDVEYELNIIPQPYKGRS
jgi:hypothetical protein